MSDLPPPERTTHPYWMYDMIKEIPLSFDAVLDQLKGLELSQGDRMTFTGNGTAFFAAWTGSNALSELDVPRQAVQSFELEHYAKLGKGELVVGVSHSGITKSTVDSLGKAKNQGARVVGLTHFAGRPIEKACDLTLVIGNGPDKSRCHTKTYIDSAAAAALVGHSFARSLGQDSSRHVDQLRKVRELLKGLVETSESQAKEFVADLPELKQVIFAGAGPNLVTAKEAALKIKESCYIPSEGIELEEEGHGPWVSLDRSSLLVVIALGAVTKARSQDLLTAATKVKAKTAVVSDAKLEADYSFLVPKSPEHLSPFLTIVPLYFVAYFLSVRLGNNPDYLRYLNPLYWDARKHIFPPGTH